MRVFAAFVIAYLLGSIPTGYWIGKCFFRKDIRLEGSGNVGATNTLRALGPVPGIIALLIDILKGYVSVWGLPRVLNTSSAPIVLIGLGLAAIAGHTWTIFLRFKGGKGVATSTGVFLALSYKGMLSAMVVFAVVYGAFRYISLGSIIGAVCMPVFLLLYREPAEFVAFSAIIALLIIFRHKENIKRLISGKEHRLTKKKAKE